MMLGGWAIRSLLQEAGASDIGLNDVQLIEAIHDENLEAVEGLLAAEANPDYQDGAALVLAADKGNLAIVDRLIDAGADVNLDWNDRRTAIAAAAEAGFLDVVESLLDSGADPLQKTYGGEHWDAIEHARYGQRQAHSEGNEHAEIIELIKRWQLRCRLGVAPQ